MLQCLLPLVILISAASARTADPTPERIRAALDRALPLLQKGAVGHRTERRCFACHNQGLPLLALTTARSRGFAIDEAELAAQMKHITSFLDSNRKNYLEGRGQGGQVDTAGYALLALNVAGWQPDATTDAVAEYLLRYNKELDHWRVGANRPPSERSLFTASYLALRGLQTYGTAAQQERIGQRTQTVLGWLSKTPAKDTEDRVFRLWALQRAGATATDIDAARAELLQTQRLDGGWAQADGMTSDAYATGSALVALHEAGGQPTDSAAYRKGMAYLLATQHADGSWHVRSRSKPFQLYFETGFPHAKDQFISSAASGWAATALALALPQVEPALVQPREVRKLVADGKHNAFTALAKFKDSYWLAFRAGKDHNSRDGQIVVLRSADAKSWKEAFRLHLADDDRDPQFLVTKDKLFLYDPALKGTELTTFATYTEDGTKWSKPQPVYEKTYILWKPCAHDGKLYAGAHKIDNTNGGKNRQVHLVVSEDGLSWKKVSTIRAGNWESETTLLFDKTGKATAFHRQKYGSPPCVIVEADAPYQEWTARKPNIGHMSGHCVHTIRGVTYFISRTLDYGTKKTGTMIYTYANGELTPYCALPSGGDCSYAEVVAVGDEMLVSYYSSHEGATNVYLARVPLKR